MQDQWIRDGRGFVLVYSITSRQTFDEVAVLHDKIIRTKDTDKVPIVLVGNKCDLKNERTVDCAEGVELAKKWNCAFFETSAKLKLNNEAAFHECVRAIRRKEAEEKPIRPKKRKICTIL